MEVNQAKKSHPCTLQPSHSMKAWFFLIISHFFFPNFNLIPSWKLKNTLPKFYYFENQKEWFEATSSFMAYVGMDLPFVVFIQPETLNPKLKNTLLKFYYFENQKEWFEATSSFMAYLGMDLPFIVFIRSETLNP